MVGKARISRDGLNKERATRPRMSDYAKRTQFPTLWGLPGSNQCGSLLLAVCP